MRRSRSSWIRDAGDVHRFCERFECRTCGIPYEVPQPRLFSFNNPFGACPTCHGFGNVIELDLDLVVPDPAQVDPAGRDRAVEQAALPRDLTELKRHGRRRGAARRPWARADATRSGPSSSRAMATATRASRGFFRWLERKKYKVHVRVFLSRYRGYLTCPGLRRRAAAPRGAGRAGRRPRRSIALCALTVREALDSSRA